MTAKNVLALVDFSDTTPRVLETASALAAATESKLLVMHVVSPEPDYVSFDVGPAALQPQVSRDLDHERRALDQLVDGLRSKVNDIAPLLVRGPVVEKVIAEAKHLESLYIVVGSHGHGAIYHALMGSITQGVLHEAPCPVVIVPPAGRPRD